MKLANLKNKTKEKLDKISTFLKEKSRWILFFIFLFFMGYSAYLWNIYIYNSTWSESRKQEYINTKEKEAIFKKDKFRSVIDETRNRKANYQKNIEDVPNIFQFK
ncbi:MAG: hypothetical protein AAB487_01080 [Patescibacteria group bacterium]